MECQNNNVTLASWNLCLGLANKKDLVSKIIMENKIDICAMQEIDIPSGYDTSILSFKGYELLTENNDVKMRTGVYIRNGMNYTRQSELEGLNNGLVIVDVKLQIPFRIICVYRVFNPPGNFTQHSYFTSQLQLIKNDFT